MIDLRAKVRQNPLSEVLDIMRLEIDRFGDDRRWRPAHSDHFRIVQEPNQILGQQIVDDFLPTPVSIWSV